MGQCPLGIAEKIERLRGECRHPAGRDIQEVSVGRMIGVGGTEDMPVTVDQKNAQWFGVRLLQQVYGGDGAAEAGTDNCNTTGRVGHDAPSQRTRRLRTETSELPISAG